MNKVFKTVFAIFLLAGFFLTNFSMAAAAGVVTLYRPSGNTYTIQPVYSWSRISGTTSYTLQVYDIAANNYPVNVVVKSLSCDATTNRCSFKSNISLASNKNYQWRVAAGKGTFSAWKTFVVLSGFNSTFNSSATGWLQRPGGPWTTSGGTTIHTNGAVNKWSSVSYNSNFNNFTYSARMKRVSTTGGASGFWVRGAPKFDATLNAVRNGYLFLYSQNGCFSVWKHVGGVVIAKQNWTLSSSIHANGWNILKVVADGPALRFYINNALVWSGSDTSFKTGQVALTMYRAGATVERLDVDWAKLGMSELFKAAEPGASDVSEEIEQGQVEIAPDASQPYGPEQAPVVP